MAAEVGNKSHQGVPAIDIEELTFSYPGIDGQPVPGARPLIQDMSLTLYRGDRCLLVGANGAGKTTLLRLIGGKHMVNRGSINIMGRSAFRDTQLVSGGELVYLGGEWRREIAFAGYDVPLTGDFSADRMLRSVTGPGVTEERRQRLIRVMDINPHWRMHQVSDGQRRRVQIAMGLLHPFQVLLLDEITVDLDVVGRADLMAFLREESEQRGATILYATHIFDGLDGWPTHMAFVSRGKLQRLACVADIPELHSSSIMEMVLSWLTAERDEARRRRAERKAQGLPADEDAPLGPTSVFGHLNNGLVFQSHMNGRDCSLMYATEQHVLHSTCHRPFLKYTRAHWLLSFWNHSSYGLRTMQNVNVVELTPPCLLIIVYMPT
eukprot:jgi/Mesvir1/15745/Mv03318-RA.1